VLGLRGPAEAAGPLPLPRPVVDPVAVEKAAELLDGAKHPMIMVGGGARHASAEVRALAERLQAPVVPFRGGRGIVGDDHPLGFTCVSGFERSKRTSRSSPTPPTPRPRSPKPSVHKGRIGRRSSPR
jgi:acetolactate synthase-1/2/3 large subunit